MTVWVLGSSTALLWILYVLDHVRVELLVPGAVQRSRHIKSPTIQTQLQHLRSSIDTPPLRDTEVSERHTGSVRERPAEGSSILSHCFLSVVPWWCVGGAEAGSQGRLGLSLLHHRRYFLPETPGADGRWAVLLWAFYVDRYLIWTHLANQSGVPPVCDVILSNVTMQPVTEVEKTVVQWDQDVCDQTCMDQADREQIRPATRLTELRQKTIPLTHWASQAASIPPPSYWEHWSPSLQPSPLSEGTQEPNKNQNWSVVRTRQ